MRRLAYVAALILFLAGIPAAFGQGSQEGSARQRSAQRRVHSIGGTKMLSSQACASRSGISVPKNSESHLTLASILQSREGRGLAAINAARRGADDDIGRNAMAAYGRLPLSFELNQGQTDGSVRFLSRGMGYALFLTGSEAVLSLQQAMPPDFSKLPTPRTSAVAALTEKFGTQQRAQSAAHAVVLHSKLVDANSQARILEVEDLPGKSNYFIGNDPKMWHTDVPTYAKIKYQDVYPGVDLVYYGNQGRLEFDFIVAPGTDPKKIGLAIVDSTSAPRTGAELEDSSALHIDPDGNLVVTTQAGELRYQKPVAYQLAAGSTARPAADAQKHFVEARYVLKSKNEVGFEVASYDATQPLIIDPILVYSTFVAGNYYDQADAIAVDSSGSAYITGFTFSSVPSFPVTTGAYQTTCGTDAQCNYTLANGGTSNADVFVTKLSADGSTLVYSTYLGGSYDESGNGIAIDSSGNAYVTGYTRSPDFPVTSGAFQNVCGPYTAIDFSCNAHTFSSCGGAMRVDGFVTKLNPTGSGLVYSTFLGGYGNDSLNTIAVNSAGEAYVVGTTDSNANTGASANGACAAPGLVNDYPTTPGGYMAVPPQSNTNWPGFAPAVVFSKLSADGSSLLYSTYFGANAPYLNQNGDGIAVDSSGNAYIAGSTNSPSFPTTPGVVQTVINRGGGIPGAGGACGGAYCHDAFVAKFDPTRSSAASLVYSTFLGGAGEDAASAIAVDSSGNAYVTGTAGYNGAPTPDFPTTPGAFQSSCPSSSCTNFNAFVTKLNPTATGLVYSSYLGGGANGSSGANAIALDSSGRAYVAGGTNSYNFPEKNQTQTFIASVDYAFVSVFKADGSDLDFSTYLGGNAHNVAQGIALDPSDNMYVTGWTLAKDFPTTAGAFQTDCGNCGNSGSNRAPFVTQISAVPTPSSSPNLSPASLGFGNQPVGTTSTSQQVTLSSNGSAPLTISSIAASAGFAETDNCPLSPSTLAPGSSCTINVTFTPQAAGAASGTITVTDDAGNSPQTVALSGTGTAPSVTLSRTSLSFGGQPLTTTSAAQSLTLTNSGTANLTISNIAASAGFGQTNNCPLSPNTLAAGASCTINVTFAPTVSGANAGTVTVTDNASGSPQTVALSGTGTDFAISATPSSQTVKAGKSATYTLTLTPISGFAGTVALSCSGVPPAGSCSISANSLTLNGTSATATVTVTTANGKKGTPKGTYTLTLTGTFSALQRRNTVTLTVQ